MTLHKPQRLVLHCILDCDKQVSIFWSFVVDKDYVFLLFLLIRLTINILKCFYLFFMFIRSNFNVLNILKYFYKCFMLTCLSFIRLQCFSNVSCKLIRVSIAWNVFYYFILFFLMIYLTGGQLIEFHLIESVDRIFRSNA